jgi:hypothetical protein
MDKQNQGIGAYKDRPGYFLGGMVGGAILGALVNKIQGKDWKRGAIFGGITGGLGNAFLKPGSIGTSWMKGMEPGIMKSVLGAATKSKGAAALAGVGLGGAAAYMADDPAFLKRKQEEEMARLEEERRRKNKEMYKDWYTNPWDNFNDGGEVMVEEETQIASAPHPMEGWYDMYDDMINSGEFRGTFDEFMEMINNSDFDIPMAARGGRIHAKDGLWANIHAKRKRIAGGSGEKMRSPGSPGAPTAKALRDSKAGGGISDLDMRLGGASNGPGTGTSDDIPAMLSDGEFVVTANAVKNLGGGDRMLGAQRMYQMMNKLDPNSQTPAEMTTVGYA